MIHEMRLEREKKLLENCWKTFQMTNTLNGKDEQVSELKYDQSHSHFCYLKRLDRCFTSQKGLPLERLLLAAAPCLNQCRQFFSLRGFIWYLWKWSLQLLWLLRRWLTRQFSFYASSPASVCGAEKAKCARATADVGVDAATPST